MEFLRHFFSLQEVRSETCNALQWERGISFSQLNLSQTKPTARYFPLFFFLFFSKTKRKKMPPKRDLTLCCLPALADYQPAEPGKLICKVFTSMPVFGLALGLSVRLVQ